MSRQAAPSAFSSFMRRAIAAASSVRLCSTLSFRSSAPSSTISSTGVTPGCGSRVALSDWYATSKLGRSSPGAPRTAPTATCSAAVWR